MIRYLQTIIVGVLLAFFVFVLWGSQDFREAGRIFPTVIASAGILVALLEILRQVYRRFEPEAADFTDLADEAGANMAQHFRASSTILLWLIGFVAMLFLIGLVPATVIFVAGLLRIQFGAPWLGTLLVTAGVLATALILSQVLVLRWPQPLIPIPGL